MRHRLAVVWALLLALVGLPALAHAIPTDPIWWAGAYDGDDLDDVVLAVTSGDGSAACAPVLLEGPSLIVVGVVAGVEPPPVSLPPLPRFSIRAPPIH